MESSKPRHFSPSAQTESEGAEDKVLCAARFTFQFCSALAHAPSRVSRHANIRVFKAEEPAPRDPKSSSESGIGGDVPYILFGFGLRNLQRRHGQKQYDINERLQVRA
jgi:hypothetical protein